jgi:hypothetical protein
MPFVVRLSNHERHYDTASLLRGRMKEGAVKIIVLCEK